LDRVTRCRYEHLFFEPIGIRVLLGSAGGDELKDDRAAGDGSG
jgi:hypothetical protein